MRPHGSAVIEALMLVSIAVFLLRWLLGPAPTLIMSQGLAQLASLLSTR